MQNNAILPIFEPQLLDIIKTSQERGDLIFTTELKDALDDSNIIFIAVGTPMSDDGSADLAHVFDAARDIANKITQDSLVVVKSTVPVGTNFKIKKEIEEILEKDNKNVNIDFASNPDARFTASLNDITGLTSGITPR